MFGLNFKTTDADLHRAFSKFGSIEKVNVVLDGPSKRSRGFAFLYFETVAMAKEAKEVMDCWIFVRWKDDEKQEMDGSEIDGFQIRVDYSITDSAHKSVLPSSPALPLFSSPVNNHDDFAGQLQECISTMGKPLVQV